MIVVEIIELVDELDVSAAAVNGMRQQGRTIPPAGGVPGGVSVSTTNARGRAAPVSGVQPRATHRRTSAGACPPPAPDGALCDAPARE
eukprot:5572316-Prymnesium_polylepis.1